MSFGGRGYRACLSPAYRGRFFLPYRKFLLFLARRRFFFFLPRKQFFFLAYREIGGKRYVVLEALLLRRTYRRRGRLNRPPSNCRGYRDRLLRRRGYLGRPELDCYGCRGCLGFPRVPRALEKAIERV